MLHELWSDGVAHGHGLAGGGGVGDQLPGGGYFEGGRGAPDTCVSIDHS